MREGRGLIVCGLFLVHLLVCAASCLPCAWTIAHGLMLWWSSSSSSSCGRSDRRGHGRTRHEHARPQARPHERATAWATWTTTARMIAWGHVDDTSHGRMDDLGHHERETRPRTRSHGTRARPYRARPAMAHHGHVTRGRRSIVPRYLFHLMHKRTYYSRINGYSTHKNAGRRVTTRSLCA